MAIPFIDLCSGIGGFHSGLVNTGHYRCVGHAEIDKNAEKAYTIMPRRNNTYRSPRHDNVCLASHVDAAKTLRNVPIKRGTAARSIHLGAAADFTPARHRAPS